MPLFTGTPGNDSLQGGALADTVLGLVGDDTLFGLDNAILWDISLGGDFAFGLLPAGLGGDPAALDAPLFVGASEAPGFAGEAFLKMAAAIDRDPFGP